MNLIPNFVIFHKTLFTVVSWSHCCQSVGNNFISQGTFLQSKPVLFQVFCKDKNGCKEERESLPFAVTMILEHLPFSLWPGLYSQSGHHSYCHNIINNNYNNIIHFHWMLPSTRQFLFFACSCLLKLLIS